MISVEQWIIMSKDRKWIAVGTPRNRELVPVKDYNGKRILTYKSKGVAENAFKQCGFYCWGFDNEPESEDLEAVNVLVEYKEK